jgi:integrase
LKPNTTIKTYRAADYLYQTVGICHGEDCLDRLITDLDVRSLVGVLDALFIRLRNDSLDRGVDHRRTWQYGRDFLLDILKRLCLVEGIPDAAALQAKVARIDDHYGVAEPGADQAVIQVRAFPAEVLKELYELISFASPRNPFRTERNMFRNWLMVMMFIHLGLRRGEMCLLKLDSFFDAIDGRTGKKRFWLNVDETPEDEFDPRTDRPSLKTIYSKRQIPVAAEMAQAVRTYIRDYRGRGDHIFLFNSQKNRPIARNSINDIFSCVSDRLSSASKALLLRRNGVTNVVPHGCRHTSSVVRLKEMLDLGIPMPEALAKLRIFFGWSPKSEMALHYARAHFEEGLQAVWDSRFDIHVAHLRDLESSR